MRPILIDGLSAVELLDRPSEEFEQIVFCGEPIVFRVGTAEVLGEFVLEAERLIVEVAQIDGGGEGVLRALWSFSERIARLWDVPEVEWRVHALSCAKPNAKLQRVRKRRGFRIHAIGGTEVYL